MVFLRYVTAFLNVFMVPGDNAMTKKKKKEIVLLCSSTLYVQATRTCCYLGEPTLFIVLEGKSTSPPKQIEVVDSGQYVDL